MFTTQQQNSVMRASLIPQYNRKPTQPTDMIEPVLSCFYQIPSIRFWFPILLQIFLNFFNYLPIFFTLYNKKKIICRDYLFLHNHANSDTQPDTQFNTQFDTQFKTLFLTFIIISISMKSLLFYNYLWNYFPSLFLQISAFYFLFFSFLCCYARVLSIYSSPM